MALRDDLLDAAISVAKLYGHEQVEPRHVWLAVVRRFGNVADVQACGEAVRRSLEPRGNATRLPNASAPCATLLGAIGSADDAIRQLLAAHPRDQRPGDALPGETAREPAPQQQPTTAAPPAQAKPQRETVAEVLAELEKLIGLAPVKARLRDVIAVVQANAERRRVGLAPVGSSLHLVFTGSPGTGKTTVARLVARLYAAAGALPGGGFAEVTRADLIAGYIGQTAIKTAEVVKRTRPGVLFIDEAYSLTPTSPMDFGNEAIATLVKAMEDHRDDLAVIVAGYSDEMTRFIESNPGLRSRFKTFVEFPDYAPGELLQIFERLAGHAQIGLGEGVHARATSVFADAAQRGAFGNARFVRSLFEQAYTRMAARAAADGRVSAEELTTLLPDDVVGETDALRPDDRRIGFDA